MELTKNEKELIRILIDREMGEEEILGVLMFMKTDQQKMAMIRFLQDNKMAKEQEILRKMKTLISA